MYAESETTGYVRNYFLKEYGKCDYNGNRTELVTYCPKCEKERFFNKNEHGHLYISTDKYVFICFKCGFKGHVSYIMNSNDPDFEKFKEWCESNNESGENNNFFKFKPENIQIPEYEETYSNAKKMEYMKSRLFNYSENDILKIPNIVFDVFKFYEINKLPIDDEKKLKWMNDNYVGFLSNKRSMLSRRCIVDDESLMRYSSKRLFKIENSDYFGGIINSENLLIKCPKIFLCEGVFDYLNLIKNTEITNDINECFFGVSCFGRNFNSVVNSLMDDYNIIKCDLIVYGDNDSDKESKKGLFMEYKKICENIRVENMTVCINTLKKDFSYSEKDIRIKKFNFKVNGNVAMNIPV